jgi:curli biogenesis system outer membrane secretion channel CsgG
MLNLSKPSKQIFPVYFFYPLRVVSVVFGTGLMLTTSPLSALSQGLLFSVPEVEQIAQSTPQVKRRVAVLDFDFSAISDPSLLSAFPGIAQGTSDLLVNALVNTNTYSVIERSRIDAVLAEQNLGTSGRVDASTAAQVGRILGVDVVIIGSVTQFDVQEKRSGFQVGGLFGQAKTKVQADVQINTRMISTSTAEIITTAEGRGSANQDDGSTVVFGIGGGSETDNRQQLLTQATRLAVEQVVLQLTSAEERLAELPPALPTVEALVADATGNTLVLNKGTTDGYQTGMIVSLERVSREVKDPATGSVIRRITTSIGQAKLIEVDASSSVATVLSGTGFRIGDIAKPIQGDP